MYFAQTKDLRNGQEKKKDKTLSTKKIRFQEKNDNDQERKGWK